LFFL
ncbi:putative membrane protein, partial [Escherichia coli EC1865]|jgi:hypothetical protein